MEGGNSRPPSLLTRECPLTLFTGCWRRASEPRRAPAPWWRRLPPTLLAGRRPARPARRPGRFSYSRRRSPIGAISATRWSASAFLHWMQPIPAERQPSAAQLRVLSSEKMRWRSKTGHFAGSPGSRSRFLAGSVIIVRSFPRRGGLVLGDPDHVSVALGHLPPIGTRQPRGRGQAHLRLGEHRSVDGVEAAGDFPGQLDVGLLVRSYGDHRSVVHEDVRRCRTGYPRKP